MKERIQKLIDIYATYVFGVDRDAGWHAPSQLESLQSASMAKRSGLQVKQLSASFSTSDERQPNDRSDDKMINEMRFLRNKHYDYKLAEMLLSSLEEKQKLALLGGPYLNYIYKRAHSEAEIADYIGIKKAVYRFNRKMGLTKIEEQLDFKDRLERLKIA